jgi:S-DNA-T family DNA segregation ATPase FtsK/SpoIIIE
MILVDPKQVELSMYANLPHLIIKDILTQPNQAVNALTWAINEMERRYTLLKNHSVRNIIEFNDCKAVKENQESKLPYIVIIVDELADLMMACKKDIEDKIRAITQKARAAGIHLIVATQRPSVDVITGTIKANLPSRIAFSVTNFQDSRTILDVGGAESLLGRGDMLYSPIESNTPKRVQGAYITTQEVAAVVDYCKTNNASYFDESIEKEIMYIKEQNAVDPDDADYDETDSLLGEVLRRMVETGQASTSMIQRHFRVGYARASRIIDQLEARGYIGALDGSRPREVRITKEAFDLEFGDTEEQ